MNTTEALTFLERHQPLPDDAHLDQATLDAFEQVRRYFLAEYDERCVPLFLGAFGNGSGFGVYQVVEDVIRRYPREQVVRALDAHLASPHQGVRNWCLQIAMEYEEPSLLPHFIRSLSSDDLDERTWAAQNIALVGTAAERPVVETALALETDEEIRGVLEEWLEHSGHP